MTHELLRAQVEPTWIDHNGHLNDAWYCVLFSRAIDVFMDTLGVDDAYRERTGHSIYTLEMHVRYLREVGVGQPVRITAQLLESDDKKVRVFLRMFHGDDGALLATSEQLLLHVDRSGPKSAPFPPSVAESVAVMQAAHASLPRPGAAGAAVALRRPSPPSDEG